MATNTKGTAPAKIELTTETADFLVLYRDTNALYNRIFETVKKYAADPDDEKRVDELFAPFVEPSQKTLAALLDIVNNKISWALMDGENTKV